MSRTGLALDRVDLRRGTLCDIGLLGLLRCTKQREYYMKNIDPAMDRRLRNRRGFSTG